MKHENEKIATLIMEIVRVIFTVIISVLLFINVDFRN